MATAGYRIDCGHCGVSRVVTSIPRSQWVAGRRRSTYKSFWPVTQNPLQSPTSGASDVFQTPALFRVGKRIDKSGNRISSSPGLISPISAKQLQSSTPPPCIDNEFGNGRLAAKWPLQPVYPTPSWVFRHPTSRRSVTTSKLLSPMAGPLAPPVRPAVKDVCCWIPAVSRRSPTTSTA